MVEVEGNYKCFICNINGLTHQQWKDHQLYDEHIALVKQLTKKQHYCKKCDYQFEDRRRFERHCESKKHKFGQLTIDELYCNKCNTQCQNKAKWDEHILTKKHLNDKEKTTSEELFCNKCNLQCHNNSEWEKHIKTKKHNINRNQERTCEVCKVDCVSDVTWEKHIKSKKHIKNTIINGTEISRTIQQGVDQGSQTD